MKSSAAWMARISAKSNISILSAIAPANFSPATHFVENTTGTGFVHIAPGHGLEDYGLGLANGLPIYSPVDDDGTFAHTNDLPVEQQMPAEMLGKSILEKHGKSDANEAVLHELRVAQSLLHQENYHHSYPHCWRSKTPVIFRAMDQWFIEIDHDEFSRRRALDEINRVNWMPDWGKNRIEAAVKVAAGLVHLAPTHLGRADPRLLRCEGQCRSWTRRSCARPRI